MPKETEVNVYRKIPVKVRAIKWNGTNAEEVMKFCNGDWFSYQHDNYQLGIHTLEGIMYANIGDYIIQGVKDKAYIDQIIKTNAERASNDHRTSIRSNSV